MIYPIVKGISKFFFAIFFRVTVKGKENVPKEGSAILCSNHISNFDPLIVAVYLDRLPRFMAKKELFKVFGLGFLIKKLHGFPVDRNAADMTAFKSAVAVLKSGEMLAMFAQGTRVKDGEEKAAKAGVALFAMKGDAPVIPVTISSTYKLFSKIIVSYGTPMPLDEFRGKRLKTDVLEEITDLIMEKINEMKEVV